MAKLCPAVACSDYMLLLFYVTKTTNYINNWKIMNKMTLLLIAIFSFGLLHAQVGINTKNPQGAFHIDPKSDTSGASNTLDDVIVTSGGMIGVGTISPEAKLHIKTDGTAANPKSGFRLVDGNEGQGKYLMAVSNDGLATWKALTSTDAIAFVKPTSCPDLVTSTNNYYKTGSYITLPKGRWVLMVIMYMSHKVIFANSSCWVNTTFADATTVANTGQILSKIVTPDIEGAPLISAMAVFDSGSGGILSGSVVINNKKASQVYYFMAGGTTLYGANTTDVIRLFGGVWGEDNIVAYRIPEDL